MRTPREYLDDIWQQNFDQESLYSQKAKVISVDETKGTCTVQFIEDDDTTTLDGVTFKSALNNAEGIFITPTVGKYVIVTFLSNEVAFVSLVQDYDKVTIKKGSISIVMDGSNITLNGGTDTAVRASDLETKLDALITELQAHTHPDPVSGSTGTPTQTFTGFAKADWEAPNVKL